VCPGLVLYGPPFLPVLVVSQKRFSKQRDARGHKPAPREVFYQPHAQSPYFPNTKRVPLRFRKVPSYAIARTFDRIQRRMYVLETRFDYKLQP